MYKQRKRWSSAQILNKLVACFAFALFAPIVIIINYYVYVYQLLIIFIFILLFFIIICIIIVLLVAESVRARAPLRAGARRVLSGGVKWSQNCSADGNGRHETLWNRCETLQRNVMATERVLGARARNGMANETQTHTYSTSVKSFLMKELHCSRVWNKAMGSERERARVRERECERDCVRLPENCSKPAAQAASKGSTWRSEKLRERVAEWQREGRGVCQASK